MMSGQSFGGIVNAIMLGRMTFGMVVLAGGVQNRFVSYLKNMSMWRKNQNAFRRPLDGEHTRRPCRGVQ